MKRLLVSLLCLAVFFAAFSHTPALRAARSGLYVVFGDSIAAGYGLEGVSDVAGRDSIAYAGIVARTLDYDLNNFAVSGHKTSDLLEVLKRPDVLKAVLQADLITVSIGGNDLLSMSGTLMPRLMMSAMMGESSTIPLTDETSEEMYATLKENLTKIMQTLVTLNKNGTILLQTLYNPFRFYGDTTFGEATFNTGKMVDYYIDRVNEIYEAVRLSVGGFNLVDVASALNADERSYYSADKQDVHPTAFGHQIIAETILASCGKPVSIVTQPTAPAENPTTAPVQNPTTAPTEKAPGTATEKPTEKPTATPGATAASAVRTPTPVPTAPPEDEADIPILPIVLCGVVVLGVIGAGIAAALAKKKRAEQ